MVFNFLNLISNIIDEVDGKIFNEFALRKPIASSLSDFGMVFYGSLMLRINNFS